MHRTQDSSIRGATTALLLAGAAALSACQVGDDALIVGSTDSFEAYLETVYQEPDTGIYITNGDTPIQNIDELRAYYERYFRGGALIVHQTGGADSRWDSSQQHDITYCVSQSSFGSRYSEAVQAMSSAAGAWESAAPIDFVHVSSQDGNCTKNNSNVLFDVQLVNSGGQYLARAFFPHYGRSNRNVYVDISAFSSQQPSLTGVLRHELGHALGFRHEHTRPEAGVCFEDTSWRALTDYDSSSVMHYPQCNGTGSWSLSLTNKDKQGAALLYGDDGGGGGGGGGGGQCLPAGDSCKKSSECCSGSCSGRGRNKTCA